MLGSSSTIAISGMRATIADKRVQRAADCCSDPDVGFWVNAALQPAVAVDQLTP
jgi:hypothetical protein